MTWHYQATKETIHGEDIYTIREVYESEEFGLGWTANGIYPSGETKEELIQDLRNMLSDAEEFPVLDVTEGETE